MSSSEESSDDNETTSSSGTDSDNESNATDTAKTRPPMVPGYLQQTDTYIQSHSKKLSAELSALMPSSSSGKNNSSSLASANGENQPSGNIQVDLLRRQIRERSMQLGALQENLKREEDKGKNDNAGLGGEGGGGGGGKVAAELSFDERLGALEKLFVGASIAAQAFNEKGANAADNRRDNNDAHSIGAASLEIDSLQDPYETAQGLDARQLNVQRAMEQVRFRQAQHQH